MRYLLFSIPVLIILNGCTPPQTVQNFVLLALASIAGAIGATMMTSAVKDFVSKVRSAALEKVFNSSIHVDDIGAELDRQFDDFKKSGDWDRLSDAEKKAVTEYYVNDRAKDAARGFKSSMKENILPRSAPTGVSNIVLPSGEKTTTEQGEPMTALARVDTKRIEKLIYILIALLILNVLVNFKPYQVVVWNTPEDGLMQKGVRVNVYTGRMTGFTFFELPAQ